MPMSLRLRASWIAVLLLVCAVVLTAEPVKQLKPTGYVNDFAHVLNANTAAQIEDLAKQVDEKAGAQIALVTVNTLDGRDIEGYAVDLFKQWGLGGKKSDKGVLILYAIQDRRARIEVGYGLEPILPDGKVGSFQREAIPQMRSGDYSGALSLVVSRVADTIAQDAGVQLTSSMPRPPPQSYDRPQGGISLGGILLLVILFIVVLATPLRSLLFWFLLSGGGRGGWGGGGYGGGGGFGGGGGGFGGFGGGSSGGGGASSSW